MGVISRYNYSYLTCNPTTKSRDPPSTVLELKSEGRGAEGLGKLDLWPAAQNQRKPESRRVPYH